MHFQVTRHDENISMSYIGGIPCWIGYHDLKMPDSFVIPSRDNTIFVSKTRNQCFIITHPSHNLVTPRNLV